MPLRTAGSPTFWLGKDGSLIDIIFIASRRLVRNEKATQKRRLLVAYLLCGWVNATTANRVFDGGNLRVIPIITAFITIEYLALCLSFLFGKVGIL